jgi:hypothetical protein
MNGEAGARDDIDNGGRRRLLWVRGHLSKIRSLR